MRMLEVRGIEKSFVVPDVKRHTVREHLFSGFRRPATRRLEVLRGVTFDVEAGETIGLMGRNGSGKSTLLKILSGVYAPQRGRVSCQGAVTALLELGVGCNPELSARDNVLLLGTLMGLPLRAVDADLEAILSFAELGPFAEQQVKHLSSGMAARLAYSVAFHAVHEVLLVDEVVAVGDAGFKKRCFDRFRLLSEAGRTIVLVSHDPRTVAELCPRALLLEGGQIVRDGTGRAIADAYLELTGIARAP